MNARSILRSFHKKNSRATVLDWTAVCVCDRLYSIVNAFMKKVAELYRQQHAKNHTPEHMAAMDGAMADGQNFDEAHDTAMSQVGAGDDIDKYMSGGSYCALTCGALRRWDVWVWRRCGGAAVTCVGTRAPPPGPWQRHRRGATVAGGRVNSAAAHAGSSSSRAAQPGACKEGHLERWICWNAGFWLERWLEPKAADRRT